MKTVLFVQLGNDYPAHLKLGGIRRAAKEFGWQLQILTPNEGYDIPKVVRFWDPEGIVVDCGSQARPVFPAFPKSLPVVLIGRSTADDWKRSFRIELDSGAVGEVAARELLSLNLPHYAFVGDPNGRWWSAAREQGFAAALAINARGYSLAPALSKDPRRMVQALGKWLTSLPRPCGIFAADDLMAERVLGAIREIGLSAPDDFPLVGADDDRRICENTNPTITSIHIDFDLAGFLAGEFLNDLMRGIRPRHFCRFFSHSGVVRRDSTSFLGEDAADQPVRRMLAFIRQEACNGISSAETIWTSGLNRRVAEMRFRKAVGHSILDEIQAIRLERAKLLLEQGNSSVISIAQRCGYASADHFRRIFRKKTGVSPSSWEKRPYAVSMDIASGLT